MSDASSGSPSTAAEKSSAKRCTLYHILVKQHVGKHGPGICLGQVVVDTFPKVWCEVEQLRVAFDAERSAARDREVRLLQKIEDL